jgi:hypothetical protein
MTGSIRSYLSSIPTTSELHAPTQIQRPDDFPSTVTSTFTEPPFNLAGLEDLDWSRVLNHKEPTNSVLTTSWIYLWGWHVVKAATNEAYWLCRLCHTTSRARRPSSHIYKAAATNGASNHLRIVHHLTEDGHLPVHSSRQATVDSYASIAPMPARSQFDHMQFRALILRLFTTTQIPFSLIEDEAFRALLIHCQPRLQRSIPSRRSLGRYIEKAYEGAYAAVESDLREAVRRINLSFDLWTSPGRRLSLLGVVAHYLNADHKPRNILLVLLRMRVSYTAVNIAGTITGLVEHLNLTTRIGNIVTDNASENHACIEVLATKYFFDARERHVLYMGHVINLMAQAVLFGSDVDAFEPELCTSVEELELQQWRKKGSIRKLHNLIKYITHSSNRREAFYDIQRLQPQPLQSQGERVKETYDLIKDNRTRWNS